MAETQTEDILISKFAGSDNFVIERHNTNSNRVKLALKGASKRNTGKTGFPDFIIRKRNSSLLIVIECKPDTKYHASASLNKAESHAVDGALHYAEFLSKSFDVLAIGVSGIDETNLIISGYLCLKDSGADPVLLTESLLTLDEYAALVFKSEHKLRQDFHNLVAYTQTLSNYLQELKIMESKRGLLISAILIALDNQAFADSYTKHQKPQQLAQALVQSVISELQSADLPQQRLENFNALLQFIHKHNVLLEASNLVDLVADIELNVKGFVENHAFIDILGQMYVEFIRYANNDKGLGIVLTPPHIAEFFAECAGVNRNSVVYDNCVGTGGFLIAAMRKMFVDADGDKNVIESIKKHQLFGTEIQEDILALAISSMVLHRDGKTNIIDGNCFDKEIIKQVKKHKPTVGLLNPPYRAHKTRDVNELKFVLNNLECLVDGGTCIALVPMSSALAKVGESFELKERLLRKHTLQAVFSLPNELFFDSNTGVVTCALVVTAHRKHQKGKQTFFGYFKDDGFVKRKVGGRIDEKGAWEEIRNGWLNHYNNRTNMPGLAINVCVDAKAEWCAEAYMVTDYSKLKKRDFEDTIRNYFTYLIANRVDEKWLSGHKGIALNFSNAALIDESRELTDRQWKEFGLSDLFDITGTKTTPPRIVEMMDNGPYPYVTTKSTNNGVEGFFDSNTEVGGVLVVDSAVIGYCSYQKFPFMASDHVEKLVPKFRMNDFTALFLATVINAEQYRYNYGRKCSQSRMKESTVFLPIENNSLPDFKFMEKYIQCLPYSSSIDVNHKSGNLKKPFA